MTIYEAEVPGVGHKFEIELGDSERLIVLLHHDGKRELYLRPGEDQDSQTLFSLTGKQARQLGSILEGAYFQPVEMDDIQLPLGESIIEWIEIDENSSVIGQTLREANIREQTNITVVAVQREDQTIANPKPEITIEVDDILVTLGTREEQQSFNTLLETGSTESSEP